MTRARPRQKPLGFALVGLGSLEHESDRAGAAAHDELSARRHRDRHARRRPSAGSDSTDIPDRSVYSYDTMQRMADNADIDVVYVVTPNALHAEHTIKAARAGKHVLVRKADGGVRRSAVRR